LLPGNVAEDPNDEFSSDEEEEDLIIDDAMVDELMANELDQDSDGMADVVSEKSRETEKSDESEKSVESEAHSILESDENKTANHIHLDHGTLSDVSESEESDPDSNVSEEFEDDDVDDDWSGEVDFDDGCSEVVEVKKGQDHKKYTLYSMKNNEHLPHLMGGLKDDVTEFLDPFRRNVHGEKINELYLASQELPVRRRAKVNQY